MAEIFDINKAYGIICVKLLVNAVHGKHLIYKLLNINQQHFV